MSPKTLPSWQSFLDNITQKAEEWKLFSGLKSRSEDEIVQRCFGNEKLLNCLREWMEQFLSANPEKSVSESSRLRQRGNEEFKRRHDTSSLLLYNDCICVAPYASEEQALGLANRSAVLFHMDKFQECAKDAERALSFDYPKNLRFKLFIRQARCFLKLQDYDKCRQVLKQAENSISENFSTEDGAKVVGAKQEVKLLQFELSKIKENTESTSCTKSVEEMPILLNGPNPRLLHASAALDLRFSKSKGRYVVTNQDVKLGDVLFLEKPYSFVVLPEQYKSHCHHCSKALLAPIPCRNCVDVLYCNEMCATSSFASYHKWECGGMSLMSAIGVAHLGLRIILTTGSPSHLLKRVQAASQQVPSSELMSSICDDPYSAVFSLVPHIEDMQLEDIFQYCATAVLLSLFLAHKTDYFEEEQCQAKMGNTMVTQVCAVLLRHITQLVCNAHAITKLDSERTSADSPDDNISFVVPETQQRIATAIYPSASMMNHSCDPNIINSFCNEVLIVKASRCIPKGEEVFNCYGPHFRRMRTAERQAILQGQYFFHCDCSACVAHPGDSFDPTQERLYALQCSSCSGPLLNEAPGREPAGSKVAQSDVTNSHFMICNTCGSQQAISSLVCDAFCALSFFKQGCEEMDTGHMQDALSTLNQCRELQERALYHSNKDLIATYDMLAKCYATLGQYSTSVEFLELVLPAVEELYGVYSVEVAHELQKLSDVMLWNLRTMETTPSKEEFVSAIKVVERGLSILSTHYGSWNKGWQDFDKKLQELKMMHDMAEVKDNFKCKLQL